MNAPLILHLILVTTLAGEEIQLTLELQEYDRLHEFEEAVIAQLPKLGGSSTFGCSSEVCMQWTHKWQLADPIWHTLRDHNCFHCHLVPVLQRS